MLKNDELIKIKNLYGEKFMQMCIMDFSIIILKKEGLLTKKIFF